MVYVVHYVWTYQAHAGFGRENTARQERRGATLGMNTAEIGNQKTSMFSQHDVKNQAMSWSVKYCYVNEVFCGL